MTLFKKSYAAAFFAVGCRRHRLNSRINDIHCPPAKLMADARLAKFKRRAGSTDHGRVQ